MMCTSPANMTMENSTVEQEIADFDIKAPISVTICFEEEDFDKIPIKTESVTNDNQKQKSQEIDNSAFVPILEPKKEIQDDIFMPDLTEELNIYIQNNISAHLPENIEDNVSNNNTTRKRKTDNLQDKNQTKLGRKDKCHSENKNICNVSEHDGQNVSNNVTSEIAASVTATSFNSDPALQNTETTSADTSLSDMTKLHQREINVINTYITKCLTLVSEHMRCIMKAFDYHKQHRTPTESFKEIKLNYFNLSYKTIVTILLPEEKNLEFIQRFLNDTLQRARKMAGPYYIRTYKDFSTLLYEMFMWAKQQQQVSQMACNSTNQNGKSVPPTPPENSATIRLEVNKHPVQDIRNNYLTVNNLNTGTDSDKVCIFSSGPPGRELSINIEDSVKSKYFQKPAQESNAGARAVQPSSDTSESESQKSKNNTDQLKSTAEHLAKFAAKYCSSKITQKPVTTSQVPNASAVTHLKQHNEVSPNTITSGLARNMMNSIPTREPVLTSMLQMPSVPPFCGVSQHLQQQQQESQRLPPPSYGQYLQPQVEPTQPIFQYDPTRYLHKQIGQQQISMQYGQTHLSQPQQIQTQGGQAQQMQDHVGQTLQMPAQYDVNLNQLQQKMPRQYNQTKQPQVGFSQQYMQQPQLQQQQMRLQQQRLTERCPSMTALLNMVSTNPPLLPSLNPQNGQSKHVEPPKYGSREHTSQSLHWQQHNVQPQPTQTRPIQQQPTLPQPTYQTEWHQELNSIYQVGQVPQQAQKGSPRSASTDSGFISPLNFNVTTEQTMPAVPEETESIVPVITHVTSLNDKAFFVELGSCIVCKKSTKQMCMGCMKVYYCTYQCQSQDWTAHSRYCTQQPAHINSALQS